MTELVLDANNLGEAISEYMARCEVLMDQVFFARDALPDFRGWLESRFRQGDALMLLHDAPLDVVCRYLGKRPQQLLASEVERATRIAISEGWVKT